MEIRPARPESLGGSEPEKGIVAERCESGDRPSFIGELSHDFGAKDIGFVASIALLVNNITGPGVPQLSGMFVEAGWLFPTFVILAIWGMTTFSSSMFCEAMRKIPGNEHFHSRAEYTTVVKYYFGPRWYAASQVGLNGALQCLNIVSVIQSAQVMDNLLSVIFGNTVGLNLSPFQGIWTDDSGKDHNIAGSSSFWSVVNTNDLSAGNPWGCHVILSAGFVLTACMAIPCGRWNLDDNMIIQTVAFFLTIGCWLVWIAASVSAAGEQTADHPLPSIPAFNTNPSTGSQAAVLGNILFNFGFVTTVPSWVNEKKPQVKTNSVLWISTFVCIVVFFGVGLPGAYAFSDVLQGPVSNTCARQVREGQGFNCPNDLLQLLTDPSLTPSSWSSPFAQAVLKTSVYMFPVVAVVSSIPVFSIVIKYNMVENGFSKGTSYMWGVIFPWVAAFPLLYMPNFLAQFVNFSSLVFVSFTDFIVPWALYIELQKRREASAREADSFLGEDDIAAGVVPHYAIPQRLGISPAMKRHCSLVLMIALGAASVVASYLTVVQGTYTMNLQVCANVGN